jgi:transketolase
MSYKANVAHIPSALSMCDYLSVIFGNFVTPKEYRIILGKPFGAQAYYSVFSRLGWINREEIIKYGSLETNWRYIIQREHPLITYIDETMGNCLSVACGIALTDKKVYVNISDAALQEGTVWESVMFAGAKKLNSILFTIDNNNMQVNGKVSDILDIEPIDKKLTAFGWNVFVCDGHDTDAITAVVKSIFEAKTEKPTAIIFKTVKGKGISFMEDSLDWHYRKLDEEAYQKIIKELK